MKLEIQSAVNVLLYLIGNKLKPKDLKRLGNVLTQILFQNFQGHWLPDKPLFGCSFRCIQIKEDHFDGRLERACKVAEVSLKCVKKALPSSLTLWIDPYEVTYVGGSSNYVYSIYTFEGDKNNVPWQAPLPKPNYHTTWYCCFK